MKVIIVGNNFQHKHVYKRNLISDQVDRNRGSSRQNNEKEVVQRLKSITNNDFAIFYNESFWMTVLRNYVVNRHLIWNRCACISCNPNRFKKILNKMCKALIIDNENYFWIFKVKFIYILKLYKKTC